MSIKKSINDWLKRFFALDQFDFERVIIDREVIDNIIELANQAYPKEFISFLEGKARKKVLRVYGLMFQQYIANNNSTQYIDNLPIMSRVVGSVHSHPGPSNQPSSADLKSFARRGMIHLIIKTPYSAENIQAYDKSGNKISFEVVG
jgi:proteasome lid subunit RPN8/RPN11